MQTDLVSFKSVIRYIIRAVHSELFACKSLIKGRSRGDLNCSGSLKPESSYHDRDGILELSWRLTFCQSPGFWHQRLLASRLFSPLISRSAYTGSHSYTSTTLSYVVGDGEDQVGSLARLARLFCYRTWRRSELCSDSQRASTQGTVKQSRMQTGSHQTRQMCAASIPDVYGRVHVWEGVLYWYSLRN